MTRFIALDGTFDAGVTSAAADPNIVAGTLLLYDFSRSDCWDGDPTHAVHNLAVAQAAQLLPEAQDGTFDGPLGNIRQANGALQMGRELARLKIGNAALVDYMVGRDIVLSAFFRPIDALPRKWVPGMTVAAGDVISHTIDPNLVGGVDARDVWTVTQAGVWDDIDPQYFEFGVHTYGSAKAIRGVVTGVGPTYGVPALGNVLGVASAAPLNTGNYHMEFAFLSANQMVEQVKINAAATSETDQIGAFTAGASGGRRLATAPINKQLSLYAEDFANPLFNAAAGITAANPVGPRMELHRLLIEDRAVSQRTLSEIFEGEREAFARISPARGLLGSW